MKILVIDDTKKHLDAALQTLTGHEVTLCCSHDEAIKLLYPQHDENEMGKLIERYRTSGVENPYGKARKETLLPYWDAVLCDLLMPAGRNAQGHIGMEFVGQEMAVGWSLALMAAKNGAKFVAVATDMNHHNHPASAMLDSINGHVFTIDSAKMLLTNHVDRVGIAGTEHTCPKCGGAGKTRFHDREHECFSCKNGTAFHEHGKDWGKILNKLLGAKEEGLGLSEGD